MPGPVMLLASKEIDPIMPMVFMRCMGSLVRREISRGVSIPSPSPATKLP
jgi:hypothetical protein